MKTLILPKDKKVYFASDFHLGVPDAQSSRLRESKIIEWLDFVQSDASTIMLLGDLFDTWFEYKEVVPRGHIRLLGKLAEIADKGIQIIIFTGNHDFWMKDYFQKEIGAEVYFEDIIIKIGSKIFNIGHGDGLGPGDLNYKLLKKLLSSKVSRFLYLLLHPNIGMRIDKYFSQKGYKHSQGDLATESYLGSEKEYLIRYAESLSDKEIDYFIFGHRHLPIEYRLYNGSYYFNTGDWIQFQSYVVFDGTQCQLLSYQKDDSLFVRDTA